MLLGEHAVLHGRRALVCAINKRMTVQCDPVCERILQIDSELGFYEAPLDVLVDHSDFRFVLDAVRQYPLTQGIKLTIKSEFSSDIGFGSSAAVTVATHAVLLQRNAGSLGAFAPPFNQASFAMELFKRSLATIHRVQGRGSGADVAASVFGGVVAYRAEPLDIHPMPEQLPLTAVYSGSKMKTADVIRWLEERRALNPDYFERIFDRMDLSVGEVINDFSQLGPMLRLNQQLMEEMGLCNASLAEIIRLFGEQQVPAKISGSGLGDCAVGLGISLAVGSFPTYHLLVDPDGFSLRDLEAL